MENETVLQENEQGEGKTFTQDEVNALIGERLSRERAKYSDYEALKEKAQKFDEAEEANKSDLQKAVEKADALEKELSTIKAANAVRDIREKVSTETGVPVALLHGATEDECREFAQAILAYKGTSQLYPSVQDAGENTRRHKADVKSQFEDWFKESLNK